MSTSLDAFDDFTDIDAGEDIDLVAVERRCSGDDSVNLNRAEAALAFTTLNDKGLSAEAIADILGVTARSVVRWRTGASRPVSLAGPKADARVAIDSLIQQGMKSPSKRTQAAARKAKDAVAALRERLAATEQEDALTAEVKRLEAKLAEAKAKLRGTPVKTPDGPRPADVRAWAAANGVPCASNGRVPAHVVEQFLTAGQVAA